MRRYKTDSLVHAATRDGLRKLGAPVFDCSPFGHGFPDLLVGVPALRKLILIELKNPDATHPKVTPMQTEFHQLFEGYPLFTFERAEDVFDLVIGPRGPR